CPVSAADAVAVTARDASVLDHPARRRCLAAARLSAYITVAEGKLFRMYAMMPPLSHAARPVGGPARCALPQGRQRNEKGQRTVIVSLAVADDGMSRREAHGTDAKALRAAVPQPSRVRCTCVCRCANDARRPSFLPVSSAMGCLAPS